ncbi:MAG: 4Fe-4S binding protein [archaeon]
MTKVKKTPLKDPYKKLKGWKEIPIGGIIEDAGNSRYYNTGDWRNFFPVRDKKICTDCLICWIFCPEGCIKVKAGKLTGFDMDKCKGCGICAEVCPVKCIKMVKEKKE